MKPQWAENKICLIRGALGHSSDTRIVTLASTLVSIEKLAHTDAWTEGMYLEEFNSPDATILLALSSEAILSEQPFVSDACRAPEPIKYCFDSTTEILGFCCIRTLFEVSEVRNIIVSPSHQGLGIGARLLQVSGAEAKGAGAEELTLEVRESNAKARHLYHKIGFKQVGIRPGYYRDNNEAAIIMTLKLCC